MSIGATYYAEKLAKQNGFKIFYWKEGDRVRITVRCESTGNSLTTVDRYQSRGVVAEACVRELKKSLALCPHCQRRMYA